MPVCEFCKICVSLGRCFVNITWTPSWFTINVTLRMCIVNRSLIWPLPSASIWRVHNSIRSWIGCDSLILHKMDQSIWKNSKWLFLLKKILRPIKNRRLWDKKKLSPLWLILLLIRWRRSRLGWKNFLIGWMLITVKQLHLLNCAKDFWHSTSILDMC